MNENLQAMQLPRESENQRAPFSIPALRTALQLAW